LMMESRLPTSLDVSRAASGFTLKTDSDNRYAVHETFTIIFNTEAWSKPGIFPVVRRSGWC
jgi:hypothetical protein